MKAMILTLITVALMCGVCMIKAMCPGGVCGANAPSYAQRVAANVAKVKAQPAKPAAQPRK